MEIVHSNLKAHSTVLDSLTIQLLNHPEQFRVSRPGRTIAVKTKLSAQLCGQTDSAQVYLSGRVVLELSLSDFKPSKLNYCVGWGWQYDGLLLGQDSLR
jgi:hypothetical protein